MMIQCGFIPSSLCSLLCSVEWRVLGVNQITLQSCKRPEQAFGKDSLTKWLSLLDGRCQRILGDAEKLQDQPAKEGG